MFMISSLPEPASTGTGKTFLDTGPAAHVGNTSGNEYINMLISIKIKTNSRCGPD